MASTPVCDRLKRSLLALLAFPLLFAPGTALAQQTVPDGPARPGDAAPVMTFGAGGLTLEQAIAATLRHDPDLQRSRADVQRREGVIQQLRGAFDTSLLVTAEYTHRTQELSDSQKQTEINKRARLDEAIAGRDDSLQQVQALRDLITRVQQAPSGGGPLNELALISPATAATVRVIDGLIANADPATRAQFESIRTSFLSDALLQFEDDLASASTEFDGLVEDRRRLGDAPTDDVFIDGSGSLSLNKLYRSGISFSPFFDGSFTGTNFKGKPRAAEFGGKGISDVLQFRAGLNVTFPLLRGRGADSVAAAERAANFDLLAGQLMLSHQNAASVLRTVQAYWNARGAADAAAIARQSVQFQSELTTITNQIIAAGDLPTVERARAQAAEARARAQMEDAEQRDVQARVALADAMGIAVTGDPASLPLASDAFPQMSAPAAVDTLIDTAVAQRQDLQAAGRAIQSGEALVTGARADLRSRLDLQVGTWFTAIGEGNGTNALDRWVGPSAGIGLQYEKPLGNNLARGTLVQREAAVQLAQIDQRDLDRRIRLGVVEAVGTIEEAAARVAQAEAAVGFYETTVNAELQRFRAGDATLFDTVLTRQQQIQAQLALVLARQDLAQRMAQLQYQTGALVTVPAPAARD